MSRELVAVNEYNRRIGEDHHNAKLTNHEVDLARQLHDDGMTYAQIAELLGVTKRCIGAICRCERRSQYPVNWRALRKGGTRNP